MIFLYYLTNNICGLNKYLVYLHIKILKTIEYEKNFINCNSNLY